MIPEYDASRDPNCALRVNLKFNKAQRQKYLVKEARIKLSPTKKHSNISVNASKIEISIIKKILIREDIIRTCKKQKRISPVSKKKQLVLLSIEICEAIAQWRVHNNTLPFSYKGNNYLMKMATDLDSFAPRNPFLYSPLSLDMCDVPSSLPPYIYDNIDINRVKNCIALLRAEQKTTHVIVINENITPAISPCKSPPRRLPSLHPSNNKIQNMIQDISACEFHIKRIQQDVQAFNKTIPILDQKIKKYPMKKQFQLSKQDTLADIKQLKKQLLSRTSELSRKQMILRKEKKLVHSEQQQRLPDDNGENIIVHDETTDNDNDVFKTINIPTTESIRPELVARKKQMQEAIKQQRLKTIIKEFATQTCSEIINGAVLNLLPESDKKTNDLWYKIGCKVTGSNSAYVLLQILDDGETKKITSAFNPLNNYASYVVTPIVIKEISIEYLKRHLHLVSNKIILL